MSAPFTTADLQILETLIDRYGVRRTLEATAEICEEKSAHIRENWQDGPILRSRLSSADRLAKAWDKAADAIDTFAGAEDLPS
jgi:hypothetical protein